VITLNIVKGSSRASIEGKDKSVPSSVRSQPSLTSDDWSEANSSKHSSVLVDVHHKGKDSALQQSMRSISVAFNRYFWQSLLPEMEENGSTTQTVMDIIFSHASITKILSCRLTGVQHFREPFKSNSFLKYYSSIFTDPGFGGNAIQVKGSNNRPDQSAPGTFVKRKYFKKRYKFSPSYDFVIFLETSLISKLTTTDVHFRVILIHIEQPCKEVNKNTETYNQKKSGKKQKFRTQMEKKCNES